MTVISRKLLFIRSRCLAGNIKVIAAMAEGIWSIFYMKANQITCNGLNLPHNARIAEKIRKGEQNDGGQVHKSTEMYKRKNAGKSRWELGRKRKQTCQKREIALA